MVKEVDIQRTILDGIEEAGGWGKKMSNMYTNGIPDLIMVLRVGEYATHVTEIKKLDALPVRDGDLVKFAHPLTILQEQCILSIVKAGGSAAWWVVYKTKTEDLIYVGLTRDDIPTKEEFLSKCLRRKTGPRGARWSELMLPLLQWQTRLCR